MAQAGAFPVRELMDRLEGAYGSIEPRVSVDPVSELVACILSQHTTDAASGPAFGALVAAFPTWDKVVAAGLARVAEAIRAAGLANQKARTIVSSLTAIRDRVGSYSLDCLRRMPPREARAWLTELPGVGPKTASIVLCFSLGMGVVPVDTHVHRVALRMGILPRGTHADKAHDLMLDAVEPEDAYRFHMALIRHGRTTCTAQRPRCSTCPVRGMCRSYAEGALR